MHRFISVGINPRTSGGVFRLSLLRRNPAVALADISAKVHSAFGNLRACSPAAFSLSFVGGWAAGTFVAGPLTGLAIFFASGDARTFGILVCGNKDGSLFLRGARFSAERLGLVSEKLFLPRRVRGPLLVGCSFVSLLPGWRSRCSLCSGSGCADMVSAIFFGGVVRVEGRRILRSRNFWKDWNTRVEILQRKCICPGESQGF